MENITNILSELQKEGIKLKLKGDGIQVISLKKKLAPDTIRTIKANKQALINHLQKMQESQKFLHIPKLEPQENYPLSPGQQRIWILSQFKEGMLAYHMPQFEYLSGEINLTNFRRAVAAVIARHEILRTVFKQDENGIVRQWIIPVSECSCELGYLDFSTELCPEKVFETYRIIEANQPFKLEEGPLYRGSVIKLSESNFVFYLNIHHIIGDAWSLKVFRDDIMSYYQHYQFETPLQLTPLRIHYKDYSAWQISLQESERYKLHQTYWKEIFNDEIPVFNLPTRKKRPKIKTYDGTGWEAKLPTSLHNAIQQFTKEQGGSAFMVLLAAWNAISYRYTDAKDQITGTPVSGRVHKELENQIGFYINTLALQNKIEDADTFQTLYKRVKENTLEAYNHQEYPFDKLMDDVSLHYDASRNPLFDVLFTLHQAEEPTQTSEITTELKEIYTIPIKFDIEFAFHQAENHTRYTFLYNEYVYDASTMQQFVQHYFQFLEKALTQPTVKIREIDYVTESEKTLLLEGFQGKIVPYDQTETLISLFQKQVAKTPKNTAIVYNTIELTYEELDAASNQLAQYLVETYQIQADELISLKLARSEWMIITILAVLKTGGAYVPIDPSYPQERIQYIEADTNCKLSIDAAVLEKFKTQQANYAKTYAGIHPKPTDLAYIIYTSGSTGKPKGVMIEHRSISNYLQFNTKVYGFNENDVTLLVSTYCFDISLNQIFNTILTGGKLIVSNFGYNELDQLIQKHHLTWLDGTSSMSEFIPAEKSSLQKIFLGGEPLKDTVVEKFKHQQLYNGYGPTECTVTTSRGEIHKGKPITIGSPVHNTNYYVLKNEALCPIGVAGELHISGIGLARGYHNKPDLTAAKFVNNPFMPGERMYKTGDLVRWLPNGTIEFLGRLDDQVKLRGYRIELGAIEKSLVSHASISESVVLVRELTGQQELIAYYVANEPIDAAQLRAHVATSLPQYMLPSYYVHISQMPLNTNGKIAKKELPNPTVDATEVASFRVPETDLEKQVVAIWEDILGREKIGLDDDFFVLGGHSLRATRLLNTYHQEFQIRLELGDLFSATTVASQVALLSASDNENYEEIPILQPQADYAVSSGQHRLWILSQFKEGSLAYHMPNFVYLEGSYNVADFQKAVYAVVERHEILRTVFKQQTSGEVRQRIIPIENYNFTIGFEDFSNHENSEVAFENYQKQDAQQAFDLENGPLFRCCLIQLSNDYFVFYYNLHHIISDGWSMGVLRDDVMKYYQHFHQETAIDIAPLRIQYKEYSHWQQAQQSEATCVAQKNYWQQQLSGELPLLDLPTTKLRPKVKTFNGYALGTQFPEEIYTLIQDFTKQHGGSTFMVLLASWQAIFYRYSGVKDQIIGTPTSGRTHKELENQIGFYINTLALRNTLEENDTYKTFYERVKQNTLESFKHQDYPFDRLVEDVHTDYDTSRSALFDVLLSYDILKDGDEGASFGCDIQDFGEAVVNFDIRIEVQDQGDQLNYKLVFNQDVYDKALMLQLMKHYMQLLNALLTNETTAISKMEYLNEAEKLSLLETTSAAEVYDTSQTVVSLFAAQVAAFPARTAISYQGNSYTYKELDELSNQLANYLCETKKVQSNDLIAVKLAHDEWLIVTILGILKSGAAYVPIDPNYPQARISYIESDTKCKISMDAAELDTFKAQQSKYSKTYTGIPPKPTDIAYIIYTSGSTGTPKGVMIAHQNLNHLFHNATQQLFDFTEKDVWCLFHSYCFDFSVWEIFGALLSGGKLVILPKKQRIDYEKLTQICIEEGITVFNQTPTSFQALQASFIEKAAKLQIRYLIFGGEKLENTLLKNWKQNFPTCRTINMYGITETTVHNTFKELTNEDVQISGSTIGQSIPGIDIQVLDANFQLVPFGVTGEMFVTGAGLASAYFNRPAITEERFLELTINHQTKKYYRTGDLAKRLPHGELQYIGRIDDQVKIRGHRIEVAEINVALNAHEHIKESIVIAEKSSVHGAMELTAYYVLHQNTQETEQALRAYLASLLPAYMVPTFFISLAEMPLTVNGKVHKKQLPKPNSIEVASSETTEVELSDTGKQILQLWEEILQKKNIALTDDFFELGGYSLTVALMLKKLKKTIGIDIHIVDFYEEPTIENILNHTQETQKTPENYTRLLSLSDGNHPKSIYYLPLSHGIGLVFKNIADYLSDTYNNYTFQSLGMHGDESVAETFRQEAVVYANLIIENSQHTEAILFGFSFGGYIGFETAKILDEKGFTNYKLLILDVIPNFKNSIDKNTELNNLKEYVEAFGHTFDQDLVQRSVRVAENNLNILTNTYQVSGKIKNGIICVQATKNTKVLNMNAWEPFTEAAVVTQKLGCIHGEMMEETHFKSLKNILDS
ncbi:tyrocidine synthase 3 [Kordia sp. SMS9]|uniref:non-ribosomal peptide synthetase n=1 Tax=Kordia sp. SMS9 TaxID=2282170 RepID=UPI000E0DFEAA|nr:non-ribosomal peptide synthetase [Kordia sp. SMS9]AXG70723.1 tyrocidine synthase 3 [Kordia sp. SMS9]